jgi:hypothetical protein
MVEGLKLIVGTIVLHRFCKVVFEMNVRTRSPSITLRSALHHRYHSLPEMFNVNSRDIRAFKSQPSHLRDIVPPAHLPTPEQRNSINKPIQIVPIVRHIMSSNRNLIVRPYSIEVVDTNIPIRAFERENAVLAYLATTLVRAHRGVVVEETVQTCTVDEDIV